jgi:xylulose-5-phosphate/fructose-6-phosphate phosphoketolase
MAKLGEYLREVVRRNATNFRIFCLDEMESNRLDAIFEVTDRQFVWPAGPQDDHISRVGRVVEILSEHTCQAWLQGYLLTGRHGLFPCYEAFAPIVDSMLNQYAKFLKVSAEIPWRDPVSSFIYLLSSEGWRQDHNGYSHQGPGFINNLLTKKADHVRIYLPPDANCLLSTVGTPTVRQSLDEENNLHIWEKLYLMESSFSRRFCTSAHI